MKNILRILHLVYKSISDNESRHVTKWESETTSNLILCSPITSAKQLVFHKKGYLKQHIFKQCKMLLHINATRENYIIIHILAFSRLACLSDDAEVYSPIAFDERVTFLASMHPLNALCVCCIFCAWGLRTAKQLRDRTRIQCSKYTRTRQCPGVLKPRSTLSSKAIGL